MTTKYITDRTLWTLLALTSMLVAKAQTIIVNAPGRVSMGENFRISYTINTQDVSDFRLGEPPSELEVIAGPYTSEQTSYQVYNGHASSSSSITFTYTLYAAKHGSYTIPAAKARINGKLVSSRPIRITVSGTAQQSSGGAPQMHEDESGLQERNAGSSISPADLFVRVNASKTRVHEQEPILLTYKIYTRVPLSDFKGKMPDLAGFHTQEIDPTGQKVFKAERINGQLYKTSEWYQYILYPQMTGEMKIPSINFKGYVVQRNNNVNPYEAFLNGGSGYTEVEKTIVAKGLTIRVDPLPTRPADFSGGVGQMNISAQAAKREVKAGEPFNLRVVVSGVGNLKLLKNPVVAFPKDWDKYDVKVTDKTKLTLRGIEGNMIYDFLAVPKNSGTYTIPPIRLVYYDTRTNAYKTAATQPITVTVGKGDNTSGSQQDFTEQGNDIQPINRGVARVFDNSDRLFGSTRYIVGLMAPLLILLLIVWWRRNLLFGGDRLRTNRGQKASKVASQRLKTAVRLMEKGEKDAFFDEVLRTLWGYVGDKLSLPVTSLTRENIEERLIGNGVDEEIVGRFITALDECEMERYAPGDASVNMSRTYDAAQKAITDIEATMKTHRKTPKTLLVSLILLMVSLSSAALTKENADAEYLKGNYVQAIADYRELLSKGESPEIYFNLGNAYYRSDNIAQALLAYERAALLAPKDESIRMNLAFVRDKTIDKMVVGSPSVFVSLFDAYTAFFSLDAWTWMSLVAFSLLVVGLLGRILCPAERGRRLSVVLSWCCGLVFIFSVTAAACQSYRLSHRNAAIITVSSVGVKKTPTPNAKDDIILHEGTRVEITDRSFPGWYGVVLPDGREGWMRTTTVEII